MIIGIAGQKGAGKDTLADIIRSKHGYVHRKFASPLKQMLSLLLINAGVPTNEVFALINGELREVPHPALCGKTPRYAMQTLGTEWRDMLGKDLWTNILKGSILSQPDTNYVISDVRFHHEVAMIHELAGKVVLLTRGPFSNDPHPSEAEIPFLKHDFVFSNTGTLRDLELFAQRIMMEI